MWYSWNARRLRASVRRWGRSDMSAKVPTEGSGYNPMRRRFLFLTLLLAATGAAAQTDTDATDPQQAERTPKKSAEARITDVRLGFGEQQIQLSFKLLDAFDEDFQKRIDSGLPTSFTFDLVLERTRKRWFNKNVDESTLQVSAMYDAVGRQYLINYKHDGSLIESRVVKDPGELRSTMTEFTDFPAFSTEGKNPRQRLRVRVRAELRTRTIFFFIPSTVHTDWAETRKFRLAEELE